MEAASAEDCALNAAALHSPAQAPPAATATEPPLPLPLQVSVKGELVEGGEDSLVRLVPRVVYPQLKSQLPSPSQSVRQEALGLMRTLVMAFPHRWGFGGGLGVQLLRAEGVEDLGFIIRLNIGLG